MVGTIEAASRAIASSGATTIPDRHCSNLEERRLSKQEFSVVGKMYTADGEIPCTVVTVAPGGIGVIMNSAWELKVSDQVALSTRELGSFPAEVVWSAHPRYGLQIAQQEPKCFGWAAVPSWKRALDICFALGALPCLLPPILLIAIIIKMASPGPLLFKQQRVGLFGRQFTIFKFRTMMVDADPLVHETYAESLIVTNGPMTKMDSHDARLIPFGRHLRAAGLDELPQLINVLRGEMSLVGPRPCLPNEYDRYSFWQRERFNSLPGITGLWQVSGKNRTTFREMVELDIHYVRSRSLWLDLKIILKTLPAVLIEVRNA